MPADSASGFEPISRRAALAAMVGMGASVVGAMGVSCVAVMQAGIALAEDTAPAAGTKPVRDDWPAFLGPTGDGISTETGLLATWPENGPPVAWVKRIGTGYSAPSIHGKTLVLHHRPGRDSVVEAFHAETGDPIWKHSYPSDFADPYGYNNGPRCTPLLTADRCYTFGAEGVLTCLELATGKLVWSRDTEKDFDIPPAFFGVGASPILHGNLLIVMIGGQPKSGIVAFDAQTGKTVWQSVGLDTWSNPSIRVQSDRKLASYAPPTLARIHHRLHLVCLMRPGVVSLDPESGEILWSYFFRSRDRESVNAARPLVIGDTVFVSAAYDVGAALLRVKPDGRSYDVVWRDKEAMQNHWSTCIHRDGYLYGFSGRHQPGSTLRCIQVSDGKLMWETKDVNAADEPDPKAGFGRTPPQFYGRGSATWAEGKLIVQGEQGLLALVDCTPKEFREISRVKYRMLNEPSWTAPVLAHGRLYLRDEDALVCLDLRASAK